MNRSRRMEPVTRVAKNREREAARHFVKMQETVREHQLRLDELLAFREEYAQRLKAEGGAVRAGQLQDFRVFLQRLDRAIQDQQGALEGLQRELERRRAGWTAARTRHDAMDKVVDRYRRAERQRDERREQAESDEHARRMHSDRRSES